MATIQHLEKLHEILRIFATSETLEATVASEKVLKIINKTEKLLYQRTFLRDERRRLRISSELIDSKEKGLKTIRREDFIPDSYKEIVDEDHLLINIGGLMFETPKSILQRDPASLLAQLCGPEPPLLPDPEGFFYFDRDWWLFRHILNFLRDGTLPDDRQLLAQLYREAGFWNLLQLQTAIEELKLHLVQLPPEKEKEQKLWWRQLPNWWQAIDEATEKKKKEEEEKKKKESDWWKDSSYKGKTYLPLSKEPTKLITKAGEKDELAMMKTTWKTKDVAQQERDRYDEAPWHLPTYEHLRIGSSLPLSRSREFSSPAVDYREPFGKNPFLSDITPPATNPHRDFSSQII